MTCPGSVTSEVWGVKARVCPTPKISHRVLQTLDERELERNLRVGWGSGRGELRGTSNLGE